MESIRRKVEVLLNDEELIALGKQLASKETELQITIDDAKAKAGEARAAVKEIRASIAKITSAIHTGHDLREVECVRRINVDGKPEIIRLDTCEVVEVEDEDEEDEADRVAATKQPALPFGAPESVPGEPVKPCPICAAVDGNHRADMHKDAELDAAAEAMEQALEDGEPAPAPSPAVKIAAYGLAGTALTLTAEECQAFLAGKTVLVEDPSVDIPGVVQEVARLRYAAEGDVEAFDVEAGVHLISRGDAALMKSGLTIHVKKLPSGRPVALSHVLEPDETADTEPAPDYSAAAEVAAEQLATGERPEDAEAAEKPKRARKSKAQVGA